MVKILKRYINFKTKEFKVAFLMDEQHSDDAWNIYNLIQKGDVMQGQVTRKITQEGAMGKNKTETKKFTVQIQVEKYDYDGDSETIRVLGKNISENKWLGLGVYQSMELCWPKKFILKKTVFDRMHVRQLEEAGRTAATDSLVVITMEDGIAHIWLCSKSNIKLKAKIEKHIAKKKAFGQKTEK